MKSKLSVALVAGWCALTLSAGAANADIITLNVIGTMVPSSGTASCLPTCTLGGSFVFNNSTGAINSAAITVAGESPSVGLFDTVVGSFPAMAPGTFNLEFGVPGSDFLRLNITGLIGFTGGPLNSAETSLFAGTSARWDLSSGSLTQAFPV